MRLVAVAFLLLGACGTSVQDLEGCPTDIVVHPSGHLPANAKYIQASGWTEVEEAFLISDQHSLDLEIVNSMGGLTDLKIPMIEELHGTYKVRLALVDGTTMLSEELEVGPEDTEPPGNEFLHTLFDDCFMYVHTALTEPGFVSATYSEVDNDSYNVRGGIAVGWSKLALPYEAGKEYEVSLEAEDLAGNFLSMRRFWIAVPVSLDQPEDLLCPAD